MGAHMASKRIISHHHRRMSLVHRAEHSRVLLKMAVPCWELMLFHEALLVSEYMFRQTEQSGINRADFIIATAAQLMR